MKHPKFIITQEGYLRLGIVNLHLDLLTDKDQCIGGGYYEVDLVNNKLILSRISYDYGPPKWDWLETLKVPSEYRGFQIEYESDDIFIDDFDVSVELKIEYY